MRDKDTFKTKTFTEKVEDAEQTLEKEDRNNKFFGLV